LLIIVFPNSIPANIEPNTIIPYITIISILFYLYINRSLFYFWINSYKIIASSPSSEIDKILYGLHR
jgi:hypothetical protein